jgi:hypothetical protein
MPGDAQRLTLLAEPHPAAMRDGKDLYGMQEVRGSNPLSSTTFFRIIVQFRNGNPSPNWLPLLLPGLSRVPGVHGPVLVAEHEVAVVVRLARGFAFGGLAPLVHLQGHQGALWQGQGSLGFRRLDLAAPARRAPHVDPPVSRSTRFHVSLRSSPGRRPTVIDRTNRASGRTAALSSMPSCVEPHSPSAIRSPPVSAPADHLLMGVLDVAAGRPVRVAGSAAR